VKTIATVNQKGDVGKTATAACLGVGLAQRGHKVLMIDADPQANLTQMLGWHDPDSLKSPTLPDLIKGIILDRPIPKEDAVLRSAQGVDVLPSNIDLSDVEITLVNVMSRESVMKKSYIKESYSVISPECLGSSRSAYTGLAINDITSNIKTITANFFFPLVNITDLLFFSVEITYFP
jgi:chromosome partitioning protein